MLIARAWIGLALVNLPAAILAKRSLQALKQILGARLRDSDSKIDFVIA
jgi:hypothetical protein